MRLGNLWQRGERNAQAVDYGQFDCRCRTQFCAMECLYRSRGSVLGKRADGAD